jgi:hypothetical protein
MQLTQEQANKLADMVRTSPTESHDSILWAVKYNLALFIWGIESAAITLERITLACNSMREDNLYQRFGLDGLSDLPRPLFDLTYDGFQKTIREVQTQVPQEF